MSKNKDSIAENFLFQAVEVLDSLGYDYVRHLGVGGFSEVLEVRSRKLGREFAAKLLTYKNTFAGELKLWSTLQHENLLPVIDIIRRPDITIYLMPIHRQSLIFILDEKDFLASRKSFKLACAWLKDVLEGLEYMHCSKLCHLDLKTDNVLITSSLTAVIIDFTFIHVTTMKVKMCGLSLYTRPPEACGPSCTGVDGEAFDIWSFGMLALDVFTNHCIEESPTADNWEDAIYPAIFWVIQEQAFSVILDNTFPAATIEWTSVIYAQNIIMGSLRFKPECRPRASAILRHSLISGIHNLLLEVDPMWKCSCEQHKTITRLVESFGVRTRRNFQVPDVSKDYVLAKDQIARIRKDLAAVTATALTSAKKQIEEKQRNATVGGCLKNKLKSVRRCCYCCCCTCEMESE